jgi:pimeloyl-ACP methyl ester carboxylesterase
VAAVVERLTAGDPADAAEHFVDTVALGPGSWAQLPPDIQRTFIDNASTFLDEARDPEALTLDLEAIKRFRRPLFLTMGDQSPPMFAPVVATLARALPDAAVFTFPGVGHIPQVTHPAAYIEAIVTFIRKNTT